MIFLVFLLLLFEAAQLKPIEHSNDDLPKIHDLSKTLVNFRQKRGGFFEDLFGFSDKPDSEEVRNVDYSDEVFDFGEPETTSCKDKIENLKKTIDTYREVDLYIKDERWNPVNERLSNYMKKFGHSIDAMSRSQIYNLDTFVELQITISKLIRDEDGNTFWSNDKVVEKENLYIKLNHIGIDGHLGKKDPTDVDEMECDFIDEDAQIVPETPQVSNVETCRDLFKQETIDYIIEYLESTPAYCRQSVRDHFIWQSWEKDQKQAFPKSKKRSYGIGRA